MHTIDTFCGQDKSSKPAHPIVIESEAILIRKNKTNIPKIWQEWIACMLNEPTHSNNSDLKIPLVWL